MNAQVHIQSVLMNEFDRARKRNSKFSLRAFAKKLDIHPGTLSPILNGKRDVSLKVALRFAEKLSLSPKEIQEIRELYFYDQSINILESQEVNETRQLTIDHYEITTDWVYFAILSLSETDDYRDDVEWIAKRFGISKPHAQKSYDRLKRLNFLNDGESANLRTPDDIANMSLRRRLSNNLECANKALYEVELEDREFTCMTMAINSEKMPMAKTMIRAFKEKFCAFLEDENKKDEVYEMCIQLFPRTILEKNHELQGDKE